MYMCHHAVNTRDDVHLCRGSYSTENTFLTLTNKLRIRKPIPDENCSQSSLELLNPAVLMADQPMRMLVYIS